jgi:hypothetical protein
LFDGAEALRLWWLWAALWSLVALALIIIEGPGLARVAAEQTERGGRPTREAAGPTSPAIPFTS